MTRLNVENRTLAIMDNLRFLQSLNNDCIDLIAIDPPFAANETFSNKPKPPISPEELDEEIALAKNHGALHNEGIGETRVKDVWNWDEDVHPNWKAQIEDDYPRVFAVIQAVEACATENEAAYICFMAVRLIECHRVLKFSGSIYVHCDSHANSYLRMLMDAVFSSENYRNQITWRRATAHNSTNSYGNITDTLLYYTKSRGFIWNGHEITDPKTEEQLQSAYPSKDERGSVRSSDLTGAGTREGESGLRWKEYDVTARGRHWAIPRTSYYAEWINQNIIPGYTQITGVHDRLDALDAGGLISHPKKGVWPGLKRYAAADQGNPPQNLILEPTGFTNYSAGTEFVGYSTQKPLALYERIIKASSNPGDVVLDIFAGCATTAVAAEQLDRQWIACDMAYRSWTMLKRRFYLNGYALTDMSDATKNALANSTKDKGYDQPLQFMSSHVIGPNELPDRDDEDPAPHHNLQQARRGKKSATQTASWSGRISKDDAKRLLIQRFGPVCWGCGYLPRRPNGSLDDTLLEVDHIRARRSSEGKQGNDELYNLALLHRTCNGVKRNKLTLEQLREHNAHHGLLWVNDSNELIDLYEAVEFANEQIAMHVAEHGNR